VWIDPSHFRGGYSEGTVGVFKSTTTFIHEWGEVSKMHHRCKAFSLVELIVVMAILAILLGLLLSAIQAVRELANVAQCQNNLFQIGVGLVQHHDAYGVLPHNGGWDGKQKIAAKDGTLFTPSTFDRSLNTTFRWGVGEPGLSPAEQTGPWCYSILPYLDQHNIYMTRAWTEPVGTYICPSRRSAVAYEVTDEDEYGIYEAGGWKWGKIDYAANAYLIGLRPTCFRFIQITDGASNTLMVGEKAFDANVMMPNSWYYDRAFFLGGGATTARRGLEVWQDGPGVPYKQNWGSAHNGAANFLFADCSVRTFAFGTPWTVMAPLLVPNDGDILPQPGGEL
jgi:prepilin-type N-terminal cleavage/methylation domain-containing protein/prepilin-type processing-associated H-X9-DG protein